MRRRTFPVGTVAAISVRGGSEWRLRLAQVEALHKLCLSCANRLVTVLPVDGEIIASALDAGFSDFEDAVQYHAALKGGVACLVTRNVRDFRRATIEVCTAEEFLARRSRSET